MRRSRWAAIAAGTLVSVAIAATVAGAASVGAATLRAGAPVLARTALLAVTSGRVTLRAPGSSVFVPLAGSKLVPFGTTVNATAGTVQVTTATAQAGQTQSALFYDGQFRLSQLASGATDLVLNAPLHCAALHAVEATAHKGSSKVRSLWGKGHGDFTTTGRYAAATVVGTQWLTTDSCTGTKVSVAEGHVNVENLATKQTTMIGAGQSVTVGTLPSTTLTFVGGLDLAGYCAKTGFCTAALTKPLSGPNDAYNNWVCVGAGGKKTPIDLQAACAATYSVRPIIAKPTSPNNAYSWGCYKG